MFRPRLKRWRISPVLAVLALLAPLLWSNDGSQLPHLFSGDEPHYLLSINSVILDGDLNLANNYAAVHKGATQAGQSFAGSALDHQSVWFENGRRRNWENVYERSPDNFDRGSDGNPVPRLQNGATPPPSGHPEYSQHPMGMALLLSPMLYAFRNTAYVEPLAIACSSIAIITAFFLLRALLRKYTASELHADVVALVAILGTPAWHYARTLFTEPYLLLFAVATYSFGLRGYPTLAGAAVALGIQMKPPFILLGVPVLALYVIGRDRFATICFATPIAMGIAVLFYLNYSMFSSPFLAAQAWLPGSVVRGVGGILFSMKYGLLLVAPSFFVALVAWPSFIKHFPRDALVIGAGFLSYFLIAASWKYWNGATAYAARIAMPVIPLLFVSMVVLPMTRIWARRAARIGMVLTCAVSIIINGFAALPYWMNFDTNPPVRLAHFLKATFLYDATR